MLAQAGTVGQVLSRQAEQNLRRKDNPHVHTVAAYRTFRRARTVKTGAPILQTEHRLSVRSQNSGSGHPVIKVPGVDAHIHLYLSGIVG